VAYHPHDRGAGEVAAPGEPVSASDTIAAVATPPGVGGIGIVRVSGPAVRALAQALLRRLPAPRRATYATFHDADEEPIDRGLALFFPAPHSFTGEDVLELHGHGGPVVLDMLLRRVLELGARIARPGEFTERGFLHGKLDLAQAEAVADLIESSSESAARSALRSLQGRFSQQVRDLVEGLVALRTFVEAAIDFPEEEVDFLSDEKLAGELATLLATLERLRASAQQGCLLHDGMTVVLAGPPNAGKSSLLNALARQDSAIVSAIPGTTRDVVRERIAINGMPVHVLDTAGLRQGGDEIESEGMRRARAAMERADRILLVVDDTVSGDADVQELVGQLPRQSSRTLIRNKIDLSQRVAACNETPHMTEVSLSAKTGAGVELLREHLQTCMGFRPAGEGTFMARRRHLRALSLARDHLLLGQERLQVHAGELLAEELRLAQRVLGEITGEFTSEELLTRIFSSFCIGK
jgi:tRNA modification GTPase